MMLNIEPTKPLFFGFTCGNTWNAARFSRFCRGDRLDLIEILGPSLRVETFTTGCNVPISCCHFPSFSIHFPFAFDREFYSVTL